MYLGNNPCKFLADEFFQSGKLNQSEKIYDVKDDLPKEPNLDLSNAIEILTL
jgi:hypothetical protein